MGIGVDPTTVQARGANKLAIDIKGISKGIFIKFPNYNVGFKNRPLVINNLASPLNLGSKFNFEFNLMPQMVAQDLQTGLKQNCYEIQRK